VIPVASIIGVFLWALKIEKHLVEFILLRYIPNCKTGWSVRRRICESKLYIKEWQSASGPINTSSLLTRTRRVDSANYFKSDLKFGIKRLLVSAQLKTDIEEIHYLFWLSIVSFPMLYLLADLNSVQLLEIAIWGVLFIIIVISIVLGRKRRRISQIAKLAFCYWMLETISNDNDRRISSEQIRGLTHSHQPEKRKRLETMTEDLIRLAENHDWDGFENNFNSLDFFIDSLSILNTEDSVLDDIVFDIAWTIRHDFSFGTALAVLVAQTEIELALSEIERTPSTKWGRVMEAFSKFDIDKTPPTITLFPRVVELLGKWSNHFVSNMPITQTDQYQDLATYFSQGKKEWEKFYLYLDGHTIELLRLETMRLVGNLPYPVNKSKPKFELYSGDYRVQMANNLLRAAEKEIVNPLIIMKAITHWGVKPKDYLKDRKPLTLRILLEENIGLLAEDLADHAEGILNLTNIDLTKTVALLKSMESQPRFHVLLKAFRRYREVTKHFDQTNISE